MGRISKNIPLTSVKIICEGGTEVNYFEELKKKNRFSSTEIICVVSHKRDPLNIAKKAVDEYNISKKKNILLDDDLFFCVFDKDSNNQEQINKAINYLKNYPNIKIILSNPSFEYWVLLHLKDPEIKKYDNDLVIKEISKEIKKKFQKSHIKKLTNTILSSNTHYAILNAEKMEKYHKDNGKELTNILSNPSTMVHILIKMMMDIKKSKYKF